MADNSAACYNAAMKYSLRSLWIVAGLFYFNGAALSVAGLLTLTVWPGIALTAVVTGLLLFGTGASIGLIKIGRLAQAGWDTRKMPTLQAPAPKPPNP